ncbi:twin-arginine translocase subunit TatC [Flavobacterium kingsejongi]|uniref:Sec-independent protein translocase protein TatC n=1 Tax=Flavobacterium kingsejongi TaxID=1678728 RepID=A0A2S1LP47_9FLAO|nr:twin-arginine translocase subunit TatC [Flavobacterium kingsejongi]AWG25406.1 twin-arginine translocase subunit TatC [Flavobacterium kingsejongi]
MAKKNINEMSFLDHLEDLRWLFIRSTIAILICGLVAYFFNDFIFDKIIFGPKDPNFITYRFFCDLAKMFNMDESMCITEMPFTVQSRTMGGQFNADMWTAITAGFIISFPYILFEFWKFISPALYENERKNARTFIIVASFLFFVGVLFGYFLIAPLSVNFLGTYSISKEVHNDFDLDSYIGLIKTSSLACGLVFELPILMYFMAKLGVVSAAFLRKYRKISYVIILIIAAIITPPDVVSQTIVTIPIVLLYEISIFIVKWVRRKEPKEEIITANE